MTNQLWKSVDEYFSGQLMGPDPILDAVREASAAASLPAYEITANQGRFLSLLAQLNSAELILEVGTLGGYSTIWLARSLPPGGRVVTLELEPAHAEVAQQNFVRAGVDHFVEIVVGDALETLTQLYAEGAGPFDITFIDADKPGNPEYFEWALKMSRKGSLIVVDNVVRNGEVVDAKSTDASVLGVRRMCEAIALEPRVEAAALQTVGAKGYDGFVFAIVK